MSSPITLIFRFYKYSLPIFFIFGFIFFLPYLRLIIGIEKNIDRNTFYNETEDEIVFPDYNSSDIRNEWIFITSKNYPNSKLFAYKSAPKVIARNISAPGENGTSVSIPSHLEKLRDELYKKENINVIASNMVSSQRSIPEARSPECVQKSYPKRLPKTSVIIIFHNEVYSMLLRTIWSVVNRSPYELLHEIILVDDVSTNDNLKNQLEDEIRLIPRTIHIIRTKKRVGLIRARLTGAERATGSILVFIDAHMECADGWLEPISTRIASDRSVIAIPAIDSTSASDISYGVREPKINIFHWSLYFQWVTIPERELKRVHNDTTAPVRTPTFVGCAFAVDKEFFYEIGAFDDKMDIWGGENIELAFRVWQCGGLMELIPCSHIAHVYRESTYSFNGNEGHIKYRNNGRAIEVWLDSYKKFFYATTPRAKLLDLGDLSERFEIKKRLKCNSFGWLIRYIFPESNFRPATFVGVFRHGNKCLDYYDGSRAIPGGCHNAGGNQAFAYDYKSRIVSSGGECLCEKVVEKLNKLIGFCECDENEKIKWSIDFKNKLVIHEVSSLCLTNTPTDNLTLSTCNTTDEAMHWYAEDPKPTL